jgi:hypothetical protein
MNINSLQEKLRRAVSYNGLQASVTGTKESLKKRVQAFGTTFVSVLFRTLKSNQQTLVDRTLQYIPLAAHSDEVEWSVELSEHKVIEIKKSDMSSFKKRIRLSNQCLLAVLAMFQLRDKRIASAHADVNSQDRNYCPWKPSMFLGPTFLASLLEGGLVPEEYFPSNQLSFYHQIFCVYEYLQHGLYMLILIDSETKEIYLLDPLIEDRSHLSPDRAELLTRIKHKLTEKFIDIGLLDWPFGIYPHQYYVGLSDIPEEGVAIHILTMIYFVIMDAPIFINPDLIDNIRQNFCYWLMHGELPL